MGASGAKQITFTWWIENLSVNTIKQVPELQNSRIHIHTSISRTKSNIRRNNISFFQLSFPFPVDGQNLTV
jgi:hypothetical protein